ncbi:MAG: hypothetical protein LBQ10_03150 [Desulfovibrio sp.]|nr:hypothetical protein [Desulfovibrio sp.]
MRGKQQNQTEQKTGSAFSRMELAQKSLSHTVSALKFFALWRLRKKTRTSLLIEKNKNFSQRPGNGRNNNKCGSGTVFQFFKKEKTDFVMVLFTTC